MECADVAAFTFGTWQIRLCLLSKLISPEAAEAMVIDLFVILREFFVGLGNWSEFFGCFNRSEFKDLKEN